jgi:predicted ArsR family transcriptional regulator
MNPGTALSEIPDITRNYHKGNAESEIANESIHSQKQAIRAKVLDAILKQPATCEELEERLGMSHQTVSARMSELKRDGLIEKNGTRPTRSGRQAGVYKASPKQMSLVL